MEPSAADVAAVAAIVDNQPAPVAPAPEAQPAPQQTAPVAPTAPAPQAAPTQPPADPFASLFPQAPAAPTEPTQPAPTQPTLPTEPTPTPQPTQTPVEPTQPAALTPAAAPVAPAPVAPVAPVPAESYDDYMARILADVPKAPDMPDPSKIAPDDEAAIGTFFTDLMATAEQRFEANYARKQAIQTSERQLWEGAFTKYESLRDNKPLRDMVHAIRRADFDKGVATTPTQAAEKLLDALNAKYQQGVADNAVVTTIEAVQPNGGGSTDVPTTLTETNVLESLQTGGEAALAQYLDSQIKAGVAL